MTHSRLQVHRYQFSVFFCVAFIASAKLMRVRQVGLIVGRPRGCASFTAIWVPGGQWSISESLLGSRAPLFAELFHSSCARQPRRVRRDCGDRWASRARGAAPAPCAPPARPAHTTSPHWHLLLSSLIRWMDFYRIYSLRPILQKNSATHTV